MSVVRSDPDSLAARLARFAARVRPAHVLCTAGLTVVVGMVGLQAVAMPGPGPVTAAERLKIQLIEPAEPEIVAGPVMDVGELVDGFQGVPRAPAVLAVAYTPYEDEENWRDAPEPPRPSRRGVEVAVVETTLSQPQPSADERWFGFDSPRRDYRAEREARRPRWESRGGRDHREDQYERDGRGDRFVAEAAPRRYRSNPDRREGPVRYDRLARDGWN